MQGDDSGKGMKKFLSISRADATLLNGMMHPNADRKGVEENIENDFE